MSTPSHLRWGRHQLAAAAARIALLLFVVASILVSRPGPAGAATTTISMGGYTYIYPYYWFCDSSHIGNVCTTTIQVGDTVTWQNVSDTAHTTTECDGNCGAVLPPSPLPIWDSGPVAPSGTYSRQFNQAGTFNYECTIHPTQMRGQIIVAAAATSTPTLAPMPTPTPVPPVGGISRGPEAPALPLDTTGSSGPSAGLLAAAIGAATAAAISFAGAAWYARRRTGGSRQMG